MTLIKFLNISLLIISLYSCKVSSSFQPGTTSNLTAETIMIPVVEVKAPQGPTTLSLDFTESLRDYYQTNSKLIVNNNQKSDLELYATVSQYTTQQISSTAEIGGQATQMELTVTLSLKYVDNDDPNKSIESLTVTQKTPYSADLTLEEATANLLPEIIDLMTQDVFNKTLARW